MFCIKVAVCKVKLLLKTLYFTPAYEQMQGLQTGTFPTSIFPSTLQVAIWKISLPNLTTFSNPLFGDGGGVGKRSLKKKKAISRNK